MNNTTTTRTKRNLVLVAIFMAATLVVGTFATINTIATTGQSAFAYPQQKGTDKKDRNGNDNGNTITALKCQNKGSASGFDTAVDQECENLICTHPGENATCVQEGAAVAAVQQGNQTTPVKLTCEQCFTKFLSAEQISTLLRVTASTTLGESCARLEQIPEARFQVFLVELTGSSALADQIIQCLIDAGVQFSPR